MRTLRSGGFNYDREKVSLETALDDDQVAFPSKTIQSGKDDADINVIVRRFGITGQMPANPRLPSYGDYTGVSDFQTAMNIVRQAEESFMELPADLRSKFGNSPQAYLDFVSDPENADELVKLGLATKRKDDYIPPVPDVPAKEKVDDGGNTTKRAEKAASKAAGSAKGSDGESGGA